MTGAEGRGALGAAVGEVGEVEGGGELVEASEVVGDGAGIGVSIEVTNKHDVAHGNVFFCGCG
jgi:hypothetical protein